jgi:hypothetical protein
MPGRTLRLFAATAALTFLSLSPAAAGWFDGGCCGGGVPLAANWGCAPSGCAPLLPRFYYGQNCCAPVRWGCGDVCGYAGVSYAVSQPAYDVPQPIHVVPQGPLYSPPLTGYTYPVMRYEERGAYPYVPGYRSGYYGYRPVYRPSVRPGYRYGYGRRVAHYGPRYGVPRYYRGYPLRVRGQVPPAAWR